LEWALGAQFTRRFAISKFESRPERGSFENRNMSRKDKDGLRVNREIRAPQIRVIDEAGQMIGVMTVPEALRMAEERGLDLLEIAPNAAPPTCKIMDYGKWKYENKKKANQARKNQVVVTIKEVQMRPRTDQHDFETKMKHSRRFLLDGDKVKITLRFLGREMAHQELGFELLNKCIDYVKDLALVEAAPKMEGRNMFLMLAPDPLKIKEYEKLHPEEKSQSEEAPQNN
jgi:translation initiation factor IF-3